MLGRNRIKKIERLFNMNFELYSENHINCLGKYIAYITKENNVMIYFYPRCIVLSFPYEKPKFFKLTEFNKILQIIHEYLYDSRDNNKR